MMSLDNSIVRKIYGTVIPQEESVCAVGGGRVLSSKYPGAFLMHFIEYALLRGSGGYPPVWGQGRSLWQKIVLGHSKELK